MTHFTLNLLTSCPFSVIIVQPRPRIQKSTDHKAHLYVVLSAPLSPRPSRASISSSTCVSPSMLETKFHAHPKKLKKLQFCIT